MTTTKESGAEMALSNEMRRLQNKWATGQGWPKRLEWIELSGVRGWVGQRVDFGFPIVALVGENGSGKSTVLQSSASVYKSNTKLSESFASDFFPDTPFETISGVTLRFSYREGANSQTKTIRKPSDRWRGNPERPERPVIYVDLSRIQPVGARVGFLKLLKAGVTEHSHDPFDPDRLQRLSYIVGKKYANAGISSTNVDEKRRVPVLTLGDSRYSGFHQGAGEIAAAELLAQPFPKYSLVLIDEIETSLHPRAQRRLVRDLARIARENELQIVLTTHSPYVLEELPPEGRIYLMEGHAGKSVVTGVSPDFAMTRMDEEQHPECDLYVEDPRAGLLVREALIKVDKDLLDRVQIIPYGSAQVGIALGMMRHQNRFPRPSVVFLDGDQDSAHGCDVLPGNDAPEVVIFEALRPLNWSGVAERIGRDVSMTIDELNAAMTLANHHDWVKAAASKLYVGGDILWQALCATWCTTASPEALARITDPVREALSGSP
ncbi:ATP-dependent endonuclease [Aquabacterium sp. J223]|uniref:ATP-dependent nuclease n=1 Tax=Aquabacterium sp. J223 TaxID=2898431 RepID=UPI0021AE2BC1|nr:ATP-binding protein [Aquabacterium sp. J223]UUX97462.1 AAA family ATPase [Aquabacterium sp. J223]